MVGMSTSCLERIQNFLISEPCKDDRNISNGSSNETRTREQVEPISLPNHLNLENLQASDSGHRAITFRDASIAPAPGSSAVLHNINLQIEKGSLTMVVGMVGAGKSTLLKAIIGELRCGTGTLEVSTSHSAYCAQTPWLPNLTVRQIICGCTHETVEDQDWYTTVLHACAFDEDIQLLPDRDNSIIGNRGVTLSGGQKQRLVGFHNNLLSDTC